jgi:hypothetical protein
MKKINFIFIGLITVFCSCSDMFEKHQDFIKDGEIVYLSMIDSAGFNSGDERGQLKLFYRSKSSLDRTIIYWNQRKDSLVLDISQIDPKVNTLSVLVDNLEEGSYEFEVINKNSFEDKSLPYDVFGNVYGTEYQSGLTRRVIKGSKHLEGETCIDWYTGSEKLIFTELLFLDKQSNKETIIKVGTENQTIIESEIETFKYRSAYIPEVAAVDTFYSDWSDNISIQ